MYKISQASEYLAITGLGIKDIKIAKKAWVFPGQFFTTFDVSPENYSFEIQAMSVEKLPFVLPAVFTIGPRDDDTESLLNYARLVSPHHKLSDHVKDLVQGVIEGETRVLAASMTMEEIFKGAKKFKEEVFEKVQQELNQFGLFVYNANVRQLVDVPGYEYFSYLGKKTQMEAASKAKVDVAEEKMKGEIGAKEREGLTLQNSATIDAETKIISAKRAGDGRKEEIKVNTDVTVYENEREAELAYANSELAKKKAWWAREARVAEIESNKAVLLREAELQRNVEMLNAQHLTEKLKAEFLSQANVEYETKAQESNWELYQKQKAAEAMLYDKQKEAEAQRAQADTSFYSHKQAADAENYVNRKQAEGLRMMANAESKYLSTLLNELSGDFSCLKDYLMLNDDVFQELATKNVNAIHGLEPKISVWTTGGKNPGDATGDIYSNLAPVVDTVNGQTEINPPSWLGNLGMKRN